MTSSWRRSSIRSRGFETTGANHIKATKDEGFRSWCLNLPAVPADLSETGNRKRLFFESNKEATTSNCEPSRKGKSLVLSQSGFQDV